MRNLLEIQEQLLPDLMDTLKRRYTILHQIKLSGIVGRRTLASSLSMTERVLRAETDLLKAQGLIEIETLGMRISVSGICLLEELEPVMNELFGLVELEEKIRQAYGLRKVVIIPGDSESSPEVKRELGRAGARTPLSFVQDGDTIAVTGGSTLAEVAEQMSSLPGGEPLTSTWFVPARAVLGRAWRFKRTPLLPRWQSALELSTDCFTYRSAKRGCLSVSGAGSAYPGDRGCDQAPLSHYSRHRRCHGDGKKTQAG